ncbi:hypothetical protein CBR_g44465 [Chara braunii]|uniref:Reverse transcriptase n=1 Tax=Chara braunii TaxID=69332 RepID=A0A388LXQ7_CHABU|nr:hypothetical protein CBR_g44465 [Chara braunii]|eukprot:GBG87012.1 hypothetical protein CBR_g44465 [Chara braunii]
MSDEEDTREDDRILRSARRPIAHLALGPEGDRYLFRQRRERLQQKRRARAAEASRALVSEASASEAMATSAQQTTQAGSSGSVGSTVAQTRCQSTGVMASQPIVLTSDEIAIQQAALQEAQLQKALGEIKAEKERMIRRRARMQWRQADVSELEEMDLTHVTDDVRIVRSVLLNVVEMQDHQTTILQDIQQSLALLVRRAQATSPMSGPGAWPVVQPPPFVPPLTGLSPYAAPSSVAIVSLGMPLSGGVSAGSSLQVHVQTVFTQSPLQVAVTTQPAVLQFVQPQGTQPQQLAHQPVSQGPQPRVMQGPGQTQWVPKTAIAAPKPFTGDKRGEDLDTWLRAVLVYVKCMYLVYVSAAGEPVKMPTEIEGVVAKYPDLFEEPTGVVEREVIHAIEIIPESSIPKGRIYRMSPGELDELRRQLKELVEKGWIRPSVSPYGSPVLFVPKKKEGTLRMCIDCRGLNAITVKNREPLPRIDDLLDRVQGCRYFSKIDLKSGYHQIAIWPEDQHKTAFQTRYCLYEFVVMPFGLCNAPGTFQRAMNRIFQDYLDKFVIVYLDDILIFSKTVEEHVAHLDKVLSLQRQHKFKINGEKCEFGRTRVLYLGHDISAEGLKPDDAKVASICDWPRPQSVTEMRSFLGMTGYYRDFVENYSIVATPLTDLTRLDTPWEWTERCEAAFRHLNHALTHYEVLKLPDPDKPFIVTTDASQYGIGAKLAKSTHEKELYAVYKALTHWRHYLLGRFFILRTDHQTLRWMRTQPVLSDALKRWIEVIEEYDFETQYIKGEYNKVADALSRRPDFSGALITEFNLADNVTQSLVEAYREDPLMSEIIRRLEAKDKVTSPEFELVNGLLFLEKAGNKRLCVPNSESLRSLFLGECHDATDHFGYKKTTANLLQQFWWPTLMRDGKLYVETCQVCQRDKLRTQAPFGLLKPLPIPERRGESLSMDFMDTLITSKSGMRYIYVIVDRFSKFARLVVMPATAKTEYVIKMFKENWVRDFGLPKSIVIDRDVRFTSELWKAAAAEQGTQLQMTSGNRPEAGNHLEANGQAEQMNRGVQHLLRHYIKPNQVDWDEKLALITSLCNNAVHSATGVSPNSLLLTFRPRLPSDFLLPDNQPTAAPGTSEFAYRYEYLMQQAVEQMHKAQTAMIESENKHRRPSTFQIGERVWVKSSELGQEHGISLKLMPQYFGPWEVLDVVGNEPDGPSYVIRIPGHLRTYPVFHASKLAPFKETDQFPSRRSMLPPTMDGEVDIDDIVDHRELPVPRTTGRGRPPKPKLQYRVRFRHHTDPKEDRWFTREELMQTAPQVVAHYEKSLQKGKRPMVED